MMPERLSNDGPSRLSHSKSRHTSRWRRGKPVKEEQTGLRKRGFPAAV
jgi:hypothetical protein